MTWAGPGRPKGHIPDSRGALARLASMLVHHTVLIGAPVAQPQMVDWGVPCDDQGGESSCTGHGFEKMVYGTAKAQGHAGSRGDPHAVYALRAEDYPQLPVSEPLPDEGAMPATIAAGLQRFGVLAAGDGPRGVGDRLDFAQLEIGQRFLVQAVARIDASGDTLVEACVQALQRGCLCFAMQVDAGYELLSDGQVWAGFRGPSLGGHDQGIDACRMGATGLEFSIVGSWGPQFGRVWIPASIFGTVASSVYLASVAPTLSAAGVS